MNICLCIPLIKYTYFIPIYLQHLLTSFYTDVNLIYTRIRDNITKLKTLTNNLTFNHVHWGMWVMTMVCHVWLKWHLTHYSTWRVCVLNVLFNLHLAQVNILLLLFFFFTTVFNQLKSYLNILIAYFHYIKYLLFLVMYNPWYKWPKHYIGTRNKVNVTSTYNITDKYKLLSNLIYHLS